MKNITKFWFLKDFNLFKKMGKKNLMAMCHLLGMINVKKGAVLYFNGADEKLVYFLKSGVLKIVNEQNEHTHSILKMGNIFGELTLFENNRNDGNKEKAIMLEKLLI